MWSIFCNPVSVQIITNLMLYYHPPAEYLQILLWDSSAPEPDQGQCNKTGIVGEGHVWKLKHKQMNSKLFSQKTKK